MQRKHQLSAKKKVRNKRCVKNRNNKQRKFYSGKKKRHTLKAQIIVDKKTRQVICTAFSKGNRHDFRVFKESNTKIHPAIKLLTDTGYQGIQKIHKNSEHPKKKIRKNPLTQEDKQKNQKLASERVLGEHVLGRVKRFKIVSDKYRNIRKRFARRFNLIAAIYNCELKT